MSEDADDNSRPIERRRASVTFEGFGVKLGLQGYSLRLVLDMVAFALTLLIGARVWDMRTSLDAQQVSIASGNAQIVAAIRYQTCIFALPESEREKEFQRNSGICNMMGNK